MAGFDGNFLFHTVERRRRDKINGWISKLAKVVPDCACDQTKAGQVGLMIGFTAQLMNCCHNYPFS